MADSALLTILPRILIYGQGGLGKTTLLAQIAAFVWRNFKLKTRVVNADGGGTRTVFAPLIGAGVAEFWDIDRWTEKSLYLNLEFASRGYWPSDTEVPDSPLLPPTRLWRPCPECGGDSGAKSLTMVKACAACKKPYADGTLLPVKSDKINGAEKIGFWAFEGMSSFGEQLLRRLTKVDPSGGNFIPDGEMKIANAGTPHYGMAQNYLLEFIQNSRNLPVPFVAWTALERSSLEEGQAIYGPAGPGKVITSACIPKFTAVLHLDAVAKRDSKGLVLKDVNGQETLDRKLYLSPHFPSDQLTHRFAAKVALPAGAPPMPLVMDPDMPAFFAAFEKAIEAGTAKLLGDDPA